MFLNFFKKLIYSIVNNFVKLLTNMTEKRLIYLDIDTATSLVDKYDPNAPLEFPAFAVQDPSRSRIPVSMLLTKTQAKSIDGVQKKLKALQKQSKKVKFSAEQSKQNISAKGKLALELANVSDAGMKTFIKMQAKELQPDINKRLKEAGEKSITAKEMEKMIKEAIVKTEEAGREELAKKTDDEGFLIDFGESADESPEFEEHMSAAEILGFEEPPKTSRESLDWPSFTEEVSEQIEDREEAIDVADQIAKTTDNEEIKDTAEEFIEDMEEEIEELEDLSSGETLLSLLPSLSDEPKDPGLLGQGIVGGGKTPLRLRMSKTQVKKNHGGGIFADIGKVLTSVGSAVVDSFVPGLGTAGKSLLDQGIDEIDKLITKDKKGGAVSGSRKQSLQQRRLKDLKKRRKMRKQQGSGIVESFLGRGVGAVSGERGAISKKQKMFTVNDSANDSKNRSLRSRRGGEITRASRVTPVLQRRKLAVGGAAVKMEKKRPTKVQSKKVKTAGLKGNLRLPPRNL